MLIGSLKPEAEQRLAVTQAGGQVGGVEQPVHKALAHSAVELKVSEPLDWEPRGITAELAEQLTLDAFAGWVGFEPLKRWPWLPAGNDGMNDTLEKHKCQVFTLHPCTQYTELFFSGHQPQILM